MKKKVIYGVASLLKLTNNNSTKSTFFPEEGFPRSTVPVLQKHHFPPLSYKKGMISIANNCDTEQAQPIHRTEENFLSGPAFAPPPLSGQITSGGTFFLLFLRLPLNMCIGKNAVRN